MAGTLRTLAACGVAVFCGLAISGDRRTSATLRVSATVVAECTIDEAPPPARPSCRPLSRRLMQNVARAQVSSAPQVSAKADTVPTSGGSGGPLTVVFIRF
jgi:hypothetical protein